MDSPSPCEIGFVSTWGLPPEVLPIVSSSEGPRRCTLLTSATASLPGNCARIPGSWCKNGPMCARWPRGSWPRNPASRSSTLRSFPCDCCSPRRSRSSVAPARLSPWSSRSSRSVGRRLARGEWSTTRNSVERRSKMWLTTPRCAGLDPPGGKKGQRRGISLSAICRQLKASLSPGIYSHRGMVYDRKKRGR